MPSTPTLLNREIEKSKVNPTLCPLQSSLMDCGWTWTMFGPRKTLVYSVLKRLTRTRAVWSREPEGQENISLVGPMLLLTRLWWTEVIVNPGPSEPGWGGVGEKNLEEKEWFQKFINYVPWLPACLPAVYCNITYSNSNPTRTNACINQFHMQRVLNCQSWSFFVTLVIWGIFSKRYQPMPPLKHVIEPFSTAGKGLIAACGFAFDAISLLFP